MADVNKKYKVLHLNDELMEYLPYTDPTFPVEIYDDYFSDFPEHTLPCHWHPVYEFNTVISGQVTYTINGKDYLLNTGDSIFINSGNMHTAKSCIQCPDSIVYGFTFDSSLITDSRDSVYYTKYFSPINSESVPAFKIPCQPGSGSSIRSIISELYSLKSSDSVYELQCMELILRAWKILFQIISRSGLTDAVPSYGKNDIKKLAELKAILVYINNHYRDAISIDELCKIAGISRSTCFRLFDKYTSCRPNEYINSLRLKNASILLRNSDKTITEIAGMCGFDTAAYFSTTFKQRYGVAPREYRSVK